MITYPLLVAITVFLCGILGFFVYFLQQRAGRLQTQPRRPCPAHVQWDTVAIEIARDGAEGVDLDRCAACGAFRLSWWWPKDSADTTLQFEYLLSEQDAQRLQKETNHTKRRELVEELVQRRRSHAE